MTEPLFKSAIYLTLYFIGAGSGFCLKIIIDEILEK